MNTPPIRSETNKSTYFDSTEFGGLQTDITKLTKNLFLPVDLMQLTHSFDLGLTSVRDFAGMQTKQRTEILEAYHNGTINNLFSTQSGRYMLEHPIQELNTIVKNQMTNNNISNVNTAGFFYNANGFVESNLPWAVELDTLFKKRKGLSIKEIAHLDNDKQKNNLLHEVTSLRDDEAVKVLGVYFASRSDIGEKVLEDLYGDILKQSKNDVSKVTELFAKETGLKKEMLDRALGQIKRVRFGSFDMLSNYVTSLESNSAGDYDTSTLRIEIKAIGSASSARDRNEVEAKRVISHELHHAGSAQSRRNEIGRCGLRYGSDGNDVNEGMTEFLSQMSLGGDNLHVNDQSREISVDSNEVSYPIAVTAILWLSKYSENNFNVLFNAYHGDVRDENQLKNSLNEFYNIYSKIALRS